MRSEGFEEIEKVSSSNRTVDLDSVCSWRIITHFRSAFDMLLGIVLSGISQAKSLTNRVPRSISAPSAAGRASFKRKTLRYSRKSRGITSPTALHESDTFAAVQRK